MRELYLSIAGNYIFCVGKWGDVIKIETSSFL
jgi:hypothetical protein